MSSVSGLAWRVTSPVQTFAVTGVFTFLGLALVLQPDRWGLTPAYANLLVLMPATAWGAVHLAVAAALIASMLWVRCRTLVVTAHTVAVIPLAVWLVAFIVRYLTNGSTTIVNVVSWSIYLLLAVQSARLLDRSGGVFDTADDTD